MTALENRLRQTERALVLERLARQTAEVTQQTVGTWPAGVDAEEIGTLPMFSGDVDLSEQSDSVPWSQWSLTIRSHFGKFNRTTAWMLQQAETSVDDPIITDNTWRQLYEEFEPRPRVKSQEMCQALLPSTKSDESVQMVRQQENWLKVCEGPLGDKASGLLPGRQMAWDLSHQEVTECPRASRMCKTSGSTDPTDLASFSTSAGGKLNSTRTSAEISRLAQR